MTKFILVSIITLAGMLWPAKSVSNSQTKTNEKTIVAAPVDHRIAVLDAFFDRYGCGRHYTAAYLGSADHYGVDWRMLPAISIAESTCGKHQKNNNWWGWASAEVKFDSVPAGIDFVSMKLGSGRYYAGKATKGKLLSYNKNPAYAARVIRLMDQMEK